MPSESTVYSLKYGMTEEIKYIWSLKKTKNTVIICIQLNFWSPVGSWRAEKRLAVTLKFPRARHRARYRLGIYSTHTQHQSQHHTPSLSMSSTQTLDHFPGSNLDYLKLSWGHWGAVFSCKLISPSLYWGFLIGQRVTDEKPSMIGASKEQMKVAASYPLPQGFGLPLLLRLQFPGLCRCPEQWQGLESQGNLSPSVC